MSEHMCGLLAILPDSEGSDEALVHQILQGAP